MTYFALFLSFLSGTLALNALAHSVIAVGDWRPSAALSAAAALVAVLMVAL